MGIKLNWLNAYWALWLIAFIVPELWAVFNAPRYTLSDTVWAIEQVSSKQPFDFGMWTDIHWLIAVLVWGLFLWLSLHLPFGLLG
jgi:hypothetical protein